MKRGNDELRVNGHDRGTGSKARLKRQTRRVRHRLTLGSLLVYAKTVEEPFDDLAVVHVEQHQHHPIPRWWWITTAMMSAALLSGVRWLGGLIGGT